MSVAQSLANISQPRAAFSCLDIFLILRSTLFLEVMHIRPKQFVTGSSVLIEHEPPDTVMSDNRIAPTLRYEGVDIARRTIAKYREAMRIPSSIRRRRLKKINYECLTCLNRYRQLC